MSASPSPAVQRGPPGGEGDRIRWKGFSPSPPLGTTGPQLEVRKNPLLSPHHDPHITHHTWPHSHHIPHITPGHNQVAVECRLANGEVDRVVDAAEPAPEPRPRQ